MRRLLLATAILGSLFSASPLQAQSYPTRFIRIVVPYPAGGTSDLLVRLLGKKMGEALGQNIIVENVGGASGTIGAGQVANATADGYTLLFGYATQLTIAPVFFQQLTYDPLQSFAPLGGVIRFHFVMTANSATPFKTLPDLVSYAKAHPGELTYASPGMGTSTHLIGELFKLKEGIDLVHVPYRGGGPAINDYVAGRISVYWDAVAPLLPWIEKDTIRPLAVTSTQRLPELPNVPTVIEAGMPELNVFTWTAMFAPARTPRDILARLESELNKALADKEVQTAFEKAGYEMFPNSPAAITELIRKDFARWRALAAAANIKIE